MPTDSIVPDPARIVVPRQHGQVLVEPPMQALVTAAAVFPDAPEADFLGIPRWVLAETARGEWVEAINAHGRAIGAAELPRSVEEVAWIVTGHQVEFYHAGVWAKVVAADHVARQRKGLAIDILVDHDIVGELGFDVPVRDAEGHWAREGVTWGEEPNRPADGLVSPTVEQFEHWDSELGDIPAAQSDTLAHVLTDLRPRAYAAASIFAAPAAGTYPATGQGADEPYAVWMSRARWKLERAMGMEVCHVPAGQVCGGSVWLLFVLAWMRNARGWTDCYNRQLGAYRARAGIKSAMHPMPDLAWRLSDTGWDIELPFWIYGVGAGRTRMVMRRTSAGGAELVMGEEVIELAGCMVDSAWDGVQALKRVLRQSNLVVRPRALTLTMYVRLFVADLFIHGIGGALYDQITDGIMKELFGVTTPYACVSAAWLLGQAGEGESVGELLHERHHLEHNPQRGIDPFTSLRTEIAELLRDRRELVEGIGESMRRDRNGEKKERREMFLRLHEVNAALHEKVPKVLRRKDEEIAAARERERENLVLAWREYYFGLHTMESLRELMRRVTAVPQFR